MQPQTSPKPAQPQPQTVPAPSKPTRRIRGDAFWSRLKPEHRTQLQTWLLEEHLTFREVHRRVCEELHLECSLAGIGRCYQHILREKAVDELAEATDSARTILDSGAKVGEMRAAAMQLITKRLLEQALANGETSALRDLGRLVLEAEEKEIRRERAKLLREKFQFKAVDAARKLLPLVPQMEQEDMELEEKRRRQMMLKLFGADLLAQVEGGKTLFPPISTPVNSDELTSAQVNSDNGEEKIQESGQSGSSALPDIGSAPLPRRPDSSTTEENNNMQTPEPTGNPEPAKPQDSATQVVEPAKPVVEPVKPVQKPTSISETEIDWYKPKTQPAPVEPKRVWEDQPSSAPDESWDWPIQNMKMG